MVGRPAISKKLLGNAESAHLKLRRRDECWLECLDWGEPCRTDTASHVKQLAAFTKESSAAAAVLLHSALCMNVVRLMDMLVPAVDRSLQSTGSPK